MANLAARMDLETTRLTLPLDARLGREFDQEMLGAHRTRIMVQEKTNVSNHTFHRYTGGMLSMPARPANYS
jgi:hypothetical protein